METFSPGVKEKRLKTNIKEKPFVQKGDYDKVNLGMRNPAGLNNIFTAVFRLTRARSKTLCAVGEPGKTSQIAMEDEL